MQASKAMPTFDQLFEPLLTALRALGGSGSVEEIYAKTIEVAGISEDVASQMHDPDKGNMTKAEIDLTIKTLIEAKKAVEKRFGKEARGAAAAARMALRPLRLALRPHAGARDRAGR